MFSVMWSEHCSYKSSRALLRTLPTSGEDVIAGPGENAGVVRIGNGLGVAFKLESHNHPSAVEPFQGAATGVGGILRDVVAMGARPIALLDPLKFGWPDDAATRRLVRGVVGGVGSYGNCVGVPTVGGELLFDPTYTDNPLVNVMCVGLVRGERPCPRHCEDAGLPGRAVRVAHRPRRHRRGVGPGQRKLRRGLVRDAPQRPDRRPVRRQAADRSEPRARGARSRGGTAGPWRCRADLRHVGDGRSAVARGCASTSVPSHGAKTAWRRSRS